MKTDIKNIICIIVIVLTSCVFENHQKNEQIIDQKITIPEFDRNNFLCTNDTLDHSSYNEKLKEFPYKIVIYADSISCIDCDLNLIEWKQRIKEIEKKQLDVCFLFILNYSYFSIIKQTVQRDKFHYPIFFDKYGYFTKVNNLSKDVKNIIFLLNEENKIIVIGNPINNTNNWNLYLNKITSKQKLKRISS
jgi:hypothetical protein